VLYPEWLYEYGKKIDYGWEVNLPYLPPIILIENKNSWQIDLPSRSLVLSYAVVDEDFPYILEDLLNEGPAH
jgi:hypothetical protein